MINEILLGIIQAATEFLPISSSGHLALFSNLTSNVNVFFFTALHLASLLAVLIFTRKEIWKLITFEKAYRKMWLFVLIGIVPAAVVGFFFGGIIESAFSSLLIVSLGFFFTGLILLSTKNIKSTSKLNYSKSFFIGLAQIFALLPGVSRSGLTISSGLMAGVNKEEAIKFSFLMFIPLSVGAFLYEFSGAYFSLSLLVGLGICFALSLVFLNLLYVVVRKGKLWWFSIYCFVVGVVTLGIYLF